MRAVAPTALDMYRPPPWIFSVQNGRGAWRRPPLEVMSRAHLTCPFARSSATTYALVKSCGLTFRAAMNTVPSAMIGAPFLFSLIYRLRGTA